MANCAYYDESEIEKDFPLEKCGTCQHNKQDSEDGLYTCQLMIDSVNRLVKKGEN